MKLINIRPTICKFERYQEFIKEFSIDEEDLIFTNEFLYKNFMSKLNLKADFLISERYNLAEPSNDIIDKIFGDISGKNYKRIVAVGGGSIIDISKILALKHTGSTLDIFEKRVQIIKEKKLIIIPTTCGTGSEVTNISIAEIKEKETKMGLAVDELYADYAILIPELVKGLPYKFFVYSSIDALIHALESFLSPKSNTYTELFSTKAIQMILNGYKKIVKEGKECVPNIIEEFLIGSNYAGIAFGNTGVGAVHAMSYPIGGKYHVPHGEANYQFLTEVFKKYYTKNPDGKIKDLNKMLAEILNTGEDNVYCELENLLGTMIQKKRLREYGMKVEEIMSFSNSVIGTQQRLLENNYVEITKEEMQEIYRVLY